MRGQEQCPVLHKNSGFWELVSYVLTGKAPVVAQVVGQVILDAYKKRAKKKGREGTEKQEIRARKEALNFVITLCTLVKHEVHILFSLPHICSHTTRNSEIQTIYLLPL